MAEDNKYISMENIYSTKLSKKDIFKTDILKSNTYSETRHITSSKEGEESIEGDILINSDDVYSTINIDDGSTITTTKLSRGLLSEAVDIAKPEEINKPYKKGHNIELNIVSNDFSIGDRGNKIKDLDIDNLILLPGAPTNDESCINITESTHSVDSIILDEWYDTEDEENAILYNDTAIYKDCVRLEYNGESDSYKLIINTIDEEDNTKRQFLGFGIFEEGETLEIIEGDADDLYENYIHGVTIDKSESDNVKFILKNGEFEEVDIEARLAEFEPILEINNDEICVSNYSEIENIIQTDNEYRYFWGLVVKKPSLRKNKKRLSQDYHYKFRNQYASLRSNDGDSYGSTGTKINYYYTEASGNIVTDLYTALENSLPTNHVASLYLHKGQTSVFEYVGIYLYRVPVSELDTDNSIKNLEFVENGYFKMDNFETVWRSKKSKNSVAIEYRNLEIERYETPVDGSNQRYNTLSAETSITLDDDYKFNY